MMLDLLRLFFRVSLLIPCRNIPSIGCLRRVLVRSHDWLFLSGNAILVLLVWGEISWDHVRMTSTSWRGKMSGLVLTEIYKKLPIVLRYIAWSPSFNVLFLEFNSVSNDLGVWIVFVCCILWSKGGFLIKFPSRKVIFPYVGQHISNPENASELPNLLIEAFVLVLFWDDLRSFHVWKTAVYSLHSIWE